MHVESPAIKQQVREFILDNFLMGGDRSRLRDDDSFLDHRILDSTGFIELVTFVETNYGVTIADHEMIPENLDSLNRVAAFVARKQPVA